MNTQSQDETHPLIPLFPLGLVLLPHMDLPLHIFEERYKTMNNMCLEDGQTFGIVFFDGAVIRKIGCTAEITSVVKRHDDGRMDILTRGDRRFVIKDMDENRPFMQAKVLFFEDEAEIAVDEDDALKVYMLQLLKDYDRLLETDRNYDALTNMDAATLSFIIPGLEGFTPQERQPFLETTSPAVAFKNAGLHSIPSLNACS